MLKEFNQKVKIPEPEGFTCNCYQTFKEGTIPLLHNSIQKTEAEAAPPNSFYEANITLKPKPEKDITRKENYRPVSIMNRNTKNSPQNINKMNPTTYKKNYTPQQVRFIKSMQSWFRI